MTHAERLEQLYVFAMFMVGSRGQAFASVCAVTAKHPADPERWLPALVMPLIADRRAPRGDSFAELDNILRTNSTIPIDLSHPMIAGDVGRMSVLLSELRRTCLLATLQGISLKQRAVFILRHVLGLSVETCATICETTADGIRTMEGRGRRELERYLSVRCEHMDPGNACRCAPRLGNALERGLVRWPEHGEHDAATPATATYKNVGELYASLPRMRLPVVR
jgi:hypothetical protein